MKRDALKPGALRALRQAKLRLGLRGQRLAERLGERIFTWVGVKTMVPFWVPIIIRRLLFRVPKKGP